MLPIKKFSQDSDLTSNFIQNKDDPPFTVLSGSLNKPDPKPFNVNRRLSNAPEPYYYDKPQIPFEYDKQPAPAQNIEETFKGYDYPKPKDPFPFPSTTTDLPGATAKK